MDAKRNPADAGKPFNENPTPNFQAISEKEKVDAARYRAEVERDARAKTFKK